MMAAVVLVSYSVLTAPSRSAERESRDSCAIVGGDRCPASVRSKTDEESD